MRTVLLTALFLLAAAAVLAQAPAEPAPEIPAMIPPEEGQALTGDNLEEMVKDELQGGDTSYRYDPRGRRDPFRSLLQYITKGPDNCPPGTAQCLLWDEISLKGIWKVRGQFVCQILAKNGDIYWVKEGDALYDGQVTRIGIDCVYFKQKVNDPTKINPFRDVEKCVAAEETK